MITLENTKTIYDLVQNAAREYGDRTFIRYEEDEIIYDKSYREFSLDCNAVSTWINEINEKEGRKIHAALLGKSSYVYITALIGTVNSGSVAIPLDTQLRKEGLEDCLKRSDVDIVFYDWEYNSQIEAIKDNCINIKKYICLQPRNHRECIDDILKNYRDNTFVSEVKAEDCALIIFTSGTTGRGKGVMLSHGNLIDNTFCSKEKYEVGLNVLPIHHVYCLNGDVFIGMRYGRIVCINNDLSKMIHSMVLFQPTLMRMVPAMIKVLYNKISIAAQKHPEKSLEEIKESILGKKLCKIVSGGGYLSEDISKKFLKMNVVIAQGYGMSECSPKISTPDFNNIDKLIEKQASVGHVVERCNVRVVDGEIQVKSPSVMMGYYKEPDKTAEAITEDGWLRTGDIGYVDEENFVFLTGRKKNLIILSNGENVSPESIENQFDEELLISDILVYGYGDIIAAEVYPNYEYASLNNIDNIEDAVQKIINKYNKDIPSYKRIARCTIRKNPFEKTASKKIIRQKYFDNKKADEEAACSIRKPESEVQQKIYDSIAEVLGNNKFGIDSDIYECGLDSMGSVMLIEDLHDKFEKSVTFNDLMENETVLKLEQFLSQENQVNAIDLAPRKVYPLTLMQKYFAYIIKGNTTGNIPLTFKLDNSINLVRLKNAIEDTIEAHPILKGIIKMDEKEYKVFRDDSRKIDIPIIKLSEDEWKRRKEALLVPYEYTAEENLFHIYIFKTETSKYLFFDIAHIVGDGITINILFEDMNKFYCGKPVEKESYTFYEFILEEKMRDKCGTRDKNAAYFNNLMNGLKMSRSILNKKEKEECTSGRNAVIRRRFDNIVRKKLVYFCKENGVSENTMFLTGFNYCINLFSDEKDVFCTSIHGGRTDNRWARLAGTLFLTYYIRFTQVPHETVNELLHKTSKQIMNTMRCYLSTPREGEMFLQFQGDLLNIDEIGDAKAERIRLQLDSLPFHMQVMYDDKGYYYELRYWENRFDREQLEIFLNCYENILNAMMEERSVRRLKKYLPEEVYPKHYYIEASYINAEAGYGMLKGIEDAEKVKAYILDESYNKKPYGAWGTLYIMDHKPDYYSDEIENPYGKGTLYCTGKIARILLDGSLGFLENNGRIVLAAGNNGRGYYDLKKLESTLCKYDGIDCAEGYLEYDPGINGMSLKCNIKGSKEPNIDNLKEFVQYNCGDRLVPKAVNYLGRY